MQKIVGVIVRVVLFLFHLSQAVISFTAGIYVSGVIGATLMGGQLYDPEIFRSLFKVSPWIVSVVGSVLWLVVVIMELW